MSEDFQYDVFLSHSSKDKAVVRAVAERLQKDGLVVWFDEWAIKPGDNIPAKIEEGLEHSRVLVLCMSACAFGSDWAQLEAGTFRFRDPLNKERRFIPLRLDDAPIKGFLAQFLYIDWLPVDREQEYAKLREACRPSAKLPTSEARATSERIEEKAIQLDCKGGISAYAFSPDGKRVLTGGSGATMRLWDLETGRSLQVFQGHTRGVNTVAWSIDQRQVLSGSSDRTVRLWDVETGRCLRVLRRHRSMVWRVAWSPDQRHVLSGSSDRTVRLWDVETGRCLRVFEGHTGIVYRVAWSADQRHAVSGSADKTVRLWDVETGRCLRVLEGHWGDIYGLAWSADGHHAFSGDMNGSIRVWDLSEFINETQAAKVVVPEFPVVPEEVQYTNAKVLLVGDTSSGKTGLTRMAAGARTVQGVRRADLPSGWPH